MDHFVIRKNDGRYSAFPILMQLSDGRLSIGFSDSPVRDHYAAGRWTVMVSGDDGQTWNESDDPIIPHNWPAPTAREASDRFARVLSDGSYLCAGTTGWETLPADRRSEAEDNGMTVRTHIWDNEKILAKENKLFVQRSTDAGKMWERRDWPVSGFTDLIAFSRSCLLADGTVLVPVYGSTERGGPSSFVWRGGDGGRSWRLLTTHASSAGIDVNETTFLETAPSRVLAHSRNRTGFFSESWSDDGGRTWSVPLLTDIWAPHSPSHLLKLSDGRIVCTYGYRRMPMGIRAVMSRDGGISWDIERTIVLRDDGGTPTQSSAVEPVDLEQLRISGASFRSKLAGHVIGAEYPPERARPDLGYAMTAELSDGILYTAYYITLEDGVTYLAGTRWSV